MENDKKVYLGLGVLLILVLAFFEMPHATGYTINETHCKMNIGFRGTTQGTNGQAYCVIMNMSSIANLGGGDFNSNKCTTIILPEKGMKYNNWFKC